MARQFGLGLVALKMGDVAAGGGMGTSLEAVGSTVKGTAVMGTEDPQTTDFFIEEEDEPVESLVTQKGLTNLAFSCYDVQASTLEKFFGGTVVAAAAGIGSLGTITPGSAYTDGSYTNVELTGGTGTGATANITVADAVVTAVNIVDEGAGYAAGDSLSALAANIGGTGTGFAVLVSTVEGAVWEAPETVPDIEQSLEITDKKGVVVKVVRAKIKAKFNWSFTKDRLAQVDITATVLTPELAGTPPYRIVYPAA